MTQLNMARLAALTTIKLLSPLPPTPIPLHKQCKLQFYVSKTKYFLHRLIPHGKKVSMFIMYVLTIYLIQTSKWGEWAQMSANGGHTQAKQANN